MDCTKCRTKNCRTTDSCKAQKFDTEELMSTYHLHNNQKIVQAAAILVDNGRAGTLSRLQEIVEFSKKMNFKKIGIAYCYGMERDSILINEFFKESGFKTYPVSCTTGGFKQSEINQNSEIESVSCNPLAQAEQINSENVDLTITIGLCLGHDILFQKQIKSYTTTLIVKDRVHNNEPIMELQNFKIHQ